MGTHKTQLMINEAENFLSCLLSVIQHFFSLRVKQLGGRNSCIVCQRLKGDADRRFSSGRYPQNSQGKYRQPSEPVTVSVSAAIHRACRAVCQCRRDTLWLQQYGPHFDASLNSSETQKLTRISCVYTTERARVAEGQDSKWPDESVTLGKFLPRVCGGSKMSAGSFVLIAGSLR